MDTRQAAVGRIEVGKIAALVPAFVVSLAVTEMFFKWKSFSLEFIGFAVLFGALYSVQSLMAGLFKKRA